MPLSQDEVSTLARSKLRTRPLALLLYLAAGSRRGWWASTKELRAIVGEDAATTRRELAFLVEQGFLERKSDEIGGAHENHSLYCTRSPGDRLAITPGSPTRSPGDRVLYGRERAHARDPDLRSGEVVQNQNRLSVREGVQGEGTDGRTDGRKKFVRFEAELVGSIPDAWDIARPVVEKCVGKFFDQVASLEPTERELRRYFGAALDHRSGKCTHKAFREIPADRFLGCVCTRVRFEQWRDIESKSRDALARARERELAREREDAASPRVTIAQLEELAATSKGNVRS